MIAAKEGHFNLFYLSMLFLFVRGMDDCALDVIVIFVNTMERKFLLEVLVW